MSIIPADGQANLNASQPEWQELPAEPVSQEQAEVQRQMEAFAAELPKESDGAKQVPTNPTQQP